MSRIVVAPLGILLVIGVIAGTVLGTKSDQDAIDSVFGTHVECSQLASGDSLDEAAQAAAIPSDSSSVYLCENGKAVRVRDGEVLSVTSTY